MESYTWWLIGAITFLILGIIFIILSFLKDIIKNESTRRALLIAGIIFIVIGVIFMILWFVFKSRKSKKMMPSQYQIQYPQQSAQMQAPIYAQQASPANPFYAQQIAAASVPTTPTSPFYAQGYAAAPYQMQPQIV